MNHRSGFNPLEVMAAHRKALHRNMVTSLFRYERIRTTKTKALAIRRSAEKLITRAKIDSVHNRRLVSARLFDEGIVAKLFTDIALRMKDRPGGYTRIIKLGERLGDAAEVVILELVDYKLDVEGATDKTAKKSDKKASAASEAKDKKADRKKSAKGGAKPTAAKGKGVGVKKTAPPAAD
ncbi:50S ribosomal protein L17 [Treponema primitia ZAS-2]|uniref:Large ribosomal subunit protein bL17 n=1 Tax=Treponema primitia (strain ATCC BAA-887 / DSM 12427 / ZAS-2) TaxID=545694 RepID=F5YPJ5_TREPZ|nr:50S ribosomal protein L17 [Treponema primitia]AEF84525.1 50S ribosomal protein L17 [Treponema primitia ZAS-2]